jgi:hypothetical protein
MPTAVGARRWLPGKAVQGVIPLRALSQSAWLALALAPSLCLPARAADVHVPTCEEFIGIGRYWVGIDQDRAARLFGVPLRDLADRDIDLIGAALRQCLAAASSSDDKTLLTDDVRQVRSLRVARDRARRSYSDFEAAEKRQRPKLERLAATLDALPPNASSRGAVADAAATISAIFFELEQKRVTAQDPTPLIDGYPAYRDAMAALARKDQAYAEEARKELLAKAGDAYEHHRDQFERLKLPADAEDATIILRGINAGTDVRWLTLRDWLSLALANPQVTSVAIIPGASDAEFTVDIVRPGYGSADFALRQDGRDLQLVRYGQDGRMRETNTPDDRRKANGLLISVVKDR